MSWIRTSDLPDMVRAREGDSSDWEAQLAVDEEELLVEDQHRPHEAPWLQELMKEKLSFKSIPSNKKWLIDVWWPLPMPILQT
ncbi:hypothetical protein INR49_014510 [Caranx melampygus]|nr:hypothetical protein INR49_014510 [Caranx melampygus]